MVMSPKCTFLSFRGPCIMPLSSFKQIELCLFPLCHFPLCHFPVSSKMNCASFLYASFLYAPFRFCPLPFLPLFVSALVRNAGKCRLGRIALCQLPRPPIKSLSQLSQTKYCFAPCIIFPISFEHAASSYSAE
jgi:hypothetical protein